MDIIHSVADLRARLQREPNNVFVPTMGNLHKGHIQLIDLAKPRAACTVVSIFVNRLQFGPREDFDRYPRTFDADCRRLCDAGVDVTFVPEEKEIYPEPQTFVVEPSDLQHILEGAHRPGHFRGVATVVLKLFNLVMPHSAIFGKKDYQQYIVLRDMVRQLALPWAQLIDSLERAATKEVALLNIQPDAQNRVLRVTAEARRQELMLDYLRRLSATGAFAEVHLVSHQVREDDPGRPVQFAVQASFRGGAK